MTLTVRVIGSTGSTTFPTVNIAPTGAGAPAGQWPTCTQVGATGPVGEFVTVQPANSGSGPFNNGLKTIIIPMYTGPS